jgi:hypothetical protein
MLGGFVVVCLPNSPKLLLTNTLSQFIPILPSSYITTDSQHHPKPATQPNIAMSRRAFSGPVAVPVSSSAPRSSTSGSSASSGPPPHLTVAGLTTFPGGPSATFMYDLAGIPFPTTDDEVIDWSTWRPGNVQRPRPGESPLPLACPHGSCHATPQLRSSLMNEANQNSQRKPFGLQVVRRIRRRTLEYEKTEEYERVCGQQPWVFRGAWADPLSG